MAEKFGDLLLEDARKELAKGCMTPSDIEILLYHHSRPEVHPEATAPAVVDSVNAFVAAGILEQKCASYKTTEKGEALVRMLCNIEMPQLAWIDSAGNVVLRSEK